ncbi:hypothetical protein [Phaeodactylibacter xiamenensis]|uniref:hypothetical protein n=1 Tax=Phaeodactylibacter xiamenensis TaxID=1524460 RepID=UPI0024A8B944|nr:hypothetical protein [Phaeodactylibacter xiamenensis]
MKKITFVTAMLFSSLTLSAQVQFNLNTGLAFPLGDYADTEGSNPDALGATTGFFGSLGIDVYLSEGIFLHVGGAVALNDLDQVAFTRATEDAFGGNYNVLENTYEPVFLTAGPGFRIGSQEWSVDLRPRVGAAHTGYDFISARAWGANNIDYDANFGTGWGLAYGGDISITRQLGNLGIGIQASYLTASIDRALSTSVRYPGELPDVTFETFEYTPSIVTASLSVTYKIGG